MENSSPDSLKITVPRFSRNTFIAKLSLVLIFSGVFGYYFQRQALINVERGQQLTRESYLEEFDQYRRELLNNETYVNNPALGYIAMLIVLAVLIGSYELLSILLSLLIGKLTGSQQPIDLDKH
ncbi:MAG: hypothetical protein ACFBSC_15765 [Microcoleaceae cyanobacterium]